jgi:hypothetical protein
MANVSTIGFWLQGIEPTGDPAWHSAPARTRRRFWTQAGRVGAEVWDRSRAKGLDRYGKRLKAISGATAADRADDINPKTGKSPYSPMGRADPKAPPLTPVYGKSRTRSLLRYEVREHGVWYYWAHDPHTGGSWGVILSYHRTGFWAFLRGHWCRVPPRDVIGLSDAETARIRRRMDAWWRSERATIEQQIARNVIAPNRRTYRTAAVLEAHTRFPGEPAPAAGERFYQYRGTTTLEVLGARPGGGGAPGPAAPSPAPIRPRPRRPATAVARIVPPPPPPLPPVAPVAIFGSQASGRPALPPGVRFDGPLPEEILRALPAELAGVTTYARLWRLPAGRAWWYSTGWMIWQRLGAA